MLFYFSLGILILIFGASLFWRRSFDINRSEYGRIATRTFTNSFFRIVSRRISRYLASIFLKTDKLKLFKYIFITAVILITGLLLYQSYQQYQFWSQNEVPKYLLPPYQPINYFIFYAIARFFAPYLISLAAAVLFLIFVKAFNKKYNERFFYPEEPYFGALAIFLVSHPGWIFYAIAVILIYLLIQIFTLIYYKLCSITIERSNPVRNNISNGANRLEQKPVRVSLRYVWLPAAIFVIIIINYWLQTLGWWNLLKI